MAKDPEYVQQFTLPWTVSLMEDDYGRRHYICSGALISDRLAITDSSCFMLSFFASIKIYVIAGEFGSNLLFPKTQERRVIQRINSRGEENNFLQSDLTMVVLERPFKLNADIQPICLPPPQEENQRKFYYKHCLSTSFPADKHDSFMMPSLNHRKYELQLRRRFYVNPLNETHCNTFPMPILTHDSNKNLMSSLRCMGRDEGKDRNTCFSELGAPIVCEVQNEGEEENSLTYRLVGLGRNTSPCNGLSMPNIVMNVEHYRNWIIQKIKEIHGINEVI
ncbi:uncharacterized protein Dwil_GK27945 [Drosophila willistoni]|uniref:Peptidase S1 domain-containing protein n=1 Tax=Drosophila willistoni TaxID=7260 RepID=A0A0Q9WXS6_DROWI|nr:uncharacterized protein Dwil_GK27945 [Drosophila willistoni]